MEHTSTDETDGSTPDTSQLNEYDASYEDGKTAGLQEAILAIMEKNGPVTEQMRRDVQNQTNHDSLINWIKSFH